MPRIACFERTEAEGFGDSPNEQLLEAGERELRLQVLEDLHDDPDRRKMVALGFVEWDKAKKAKRARTEPAQQDDGYRGLPP